ncbi:hypothetical protein C3K47_18925 [Solitalea longa]|uniref:Uncharacterized protein n=2 Tax=Solitalea longa TaxID=2079460 RepID=A0A2S4ZWG3_9SPHI|nr:hypothetical protein C3K47_18925 [Solitalea longa]
MLFFFTPLNYHHTIIYRSFFFQGDSIIPMEMVKINSLQLFIQTLIFLLIMGLLFFVFNKVPGLNIKESEKKKLLKREIKYFLILLVFLLCYFLFQLCSNFYYNNQFESIQAYARSLGRENKRINDSINELRTIEFNKRINEEPSKELIAFMKKRSRARKEKLSRESENEYKAPQSFSFSFEGDEPVKYKPNKAELTISKNEAIIKSKIQDANIIHAKKKFISDFKYVLLMYLSILVFPVRYLYYCFKSFYQYLYN